MPRVSIITALYNKETYIAETIRSVLAQNMMDWEMIIVENGSTDKSPEVAQEYVDSRIRLVNSPKRGPGAARNFGLHLATGEWVVFLDADDLIEPDFLESRLDLLREHPQAELLAGNWEEFPDGQTVRAQRQATCFGAPAKILEQSAIAFAPWALHAVIIRRSRITPDLFWPEALDGFPSEDTAFWFPVVVGAEMAWTTKAGALYRVQTNNSRNEIHDAERWIRAVIAVIQHNVGFLEKLGRSPDKEQCANIARVFESSYRLALKKHSRPAAKLATEHAKFWVEKCATSSSSMMARKILGIRLFNLLRFRMI